MDIKTNKTGITLKLTTDEAIRLEAILGSLSGIPAHVFPFYDEIADALENPTHNLLNGFSISQAVAFAGLYDLDIR